MRRRAWLMLLTVSVALAGSSRALAAGSPLGFGLTPVGFRSYFILDAKPAGTVGGRLEVVNLTSEARTILLAPVDVSTAATGGLQYGEGDPRREGRWLKLAARSVHLSGGASVNVPFSVAVPRGASSGEHFMGIVALDSRVLHRPLATGRAVRLRLIPRLGMTVQLRLGGRKRSALVPGAARVAVAPSGASLALQISNTGNTLISATTGDITVSQRSTPLFSQPVALAAFVPRTSITYHVPWEGTPVEGTYQVSGDLRPAGAPAMHFERTVTFGRSKIREFRKQTGRPAKEGARTPIVLIVALAVALLAAVTLGVAYTRARAQLREDRR